MNRIGVLSVGLLLFLLLLLASSSVGAQPEEKFCLNYEFEFSLFDRLKTTNESDVKQFVDSVLAKTNCAQNYTDCEACSKRLAAYLTSSSQNASTFHRATTRLFMAAINPNRGCSQPPPSDEIVWMRSIIGDILDETIHPFFTQHQKFFAPRPDVQDNMGTCFDSSRVMDVVRRSSGDDQYIQLAQMTTAFISFGFSFPCLSPSRDFFLRELFSTYGSGIFLARSNLTRLIDDLDITNSKGTADQQQSTANTKRRKRDVTATSKTECVDIDSLLETFGITPSDNQITWAKFVALSPALIHQKIKCTTPNPEETRGRQLTEAEKWGYGILAVTILSISSIFGLLVFPFIKGLARNALINFFIALAVATLAGDALLHLIPFFVGLESKGSKSSGPLVQPHFYKLLTAYLTIFFFYFFERFLSWLVPRVKKKKSKKDKNAGGIEGHPNPAYMEDGGHDHHGLHQHGASAGNGHDHHSLHQHGAPAGSRDADAAKGKTEEKKKCCAINGVVVVLTVGDAMHNFCDGMAIAAAFSYSGSLGLSTSIAILCHEIPHELGDMAIYLSNGLNMLGTALFNLLASLSAFIGLFVGYGIASQSETAQQWILAVTTGTFFYIALVDLLPELRIPDENKVVIVLCHIFGFAIGGLIIILIAVYEDQIRL